jgi:hypothetical protein
MRGGTGESTARELTGSKREDHIMNPRMLAILALVCAGCAMAREPGQGTMTSGSVAADREICRQEAEAALFPYASVPASPADPRYPWTAGRNWAQNLPAERLMERDAFESCMAQRGHPVTEH